MMSLSETDKLHHLSPLLSAIRKHEAPKGYGQIYSGAKGVSKATDVSILTLNEVLAFQKRMLDAGSASTACGGYQFLRKTLMATILKMGLNGSEVWNPKLQDRMALFLMEQRGLSRYLDGTLSRTDFANNLAKEWASLPVVSSIKGGSRSVVRGQSYYAGDGLNKAFHATEAIEWYLDQILIAVTATSPVPDLVTAPGTVDAPSPVSEAPKPKGFWAAIWAWFKRN